MKKSKFSLVLDDLKEEEQWKFYNSNILKEDSQLNPNLKGKNLKEKNLLVPDFKGNMSNIGSKVRYQKESNVIDIETLNKIEKSENKIETASKIETSGKIDRNRESLANQWQFNSTSLGQKESQKPGKSATLPEKSMKNSKILDSKNQKKDETNKKEGRNNLVKLTKADLKSMLHEIRHEVEKEVDDEKNKPKDAIDELILETANKKGEKSTKIVLSKEEMKELFQSYENILKEKMISKEERFMQNWINYYEAMKDYCDKYYKLQNLLWFYNSYHPEIYHMIMNEYYLRNNEKTLNEIGLNQQLSNLGKKSFSYENLEKYIPKDLLDLNIIGPRFGNPAMTQEIQKPSYQPDFIFKKGDQ